MSVVRTPEGAAKYHEPIGSPILHKGKFSVGHDGVARFPAADGRNHTAARLQPLERLAHHKALLSKASGFAPDDNTPEFRDPNDAKALAALESAVQPGEWGDIERHYADAVAAHGKGDSAPLSGPQDVEGRVRAAYHAEAKDGGYVGLHAIRQHLSDVPREEQDSALRRLYPHRDVDLVEDDNRKALREVDRAAAVHFAGRAHHAIRIHR